MSIIRLIVYCVCWVNFRLDGIMKLFKVAKSMINSINIYTNSNFLSPVWFHSETQNVLAQYIGLHNTIYSVGIILERFSNKIDSEGTILKCLRNRIDRVEQYWKVTLCKNVKCLGLILVLRELVPSLYHSCESQLLRMFIGVKVHRSKSS